jgi:hypothetical protein
LARIGRDGTPHDRCVALGFSAIRSFSARSVDTGLSALGEQQCLVDDGQTAAEAVVD